MEVPERHVSGRRAAIGRFAALACVAGALAAGGCAPGLANVDTARYSLKHPDFWQVKQVAAKDGEPTVVVIPPYGDAVIDSGTGAVAPSRANYDGVTADVEVRLYAWADPGGAGDPTEEAVMLLQRHEDLALATYARVPDNPHECGALPRKYTLFGSAQTPLELVKRAGWRTILVGGRGHGVLVGAVARVEFEQDPARYCHNLSNMRVQLQNLLDGLTPPAGKPPVGSASGTEQRP